jgi:hypothetical protein
VSLFLAFLWMRLGQGQEERAVKGAGNDVRLSGGFFQFSLFFLFL